MRWMRTSRRAVTRPMPLRMVLKSGRTKQMDPAVKDQQTDGTDAKRRMLRKRRDNTREGLER